MDAMLPESTEVSLTILTFDFQIRGKIIIPGSVQTFINDEQKPTLTVVGAEITGTLPTNPVKMTQPELIINKRSIFALLFDVMPPKGSIAIPPRAETLVMYVQDFAISGRFYMGQDARLTDFADASLQQFIVIGEPKIFPITQVRPGLVHTAPFGMMHKTAFRFYHKG